MEETRIGPLVARLSFLPYWYFSTHYNSLFCNCSPFSPYHPIEKMGDMKPTSTLSPLSVVAYSVFIQILASVILKEE
jgi:hypothetical protein